VLHIQFKWNYTENPSNHVNIQKVTTRKLINILFYITPLPSCSPKVIRDSTLTLHIKTPLFKVHGDVSLPFRGISVN